MVCLNGVAQEKHRRTVTAAKPQRGAGRLTGTCGGVTCGSLIKTANRAVFYRLDWQPGFPVPLKISVLSEFD